MIEKLTPGVLWTNLMILLSAWLYSFQEPEHYHLINMVIVYWVFTFATCVFSFYLAHNKPDQLQQSALTSLLSLCLYMIFLLNRLSQIA